VIARALSVAGAALLAVAAACTLAPVPEREGALPSPAGASRVHPAASPDRVAGLRRPLQAAPVSADGSCRADRGVYAAEFPGAKGFAPGTGYVAYGPGPVAPAIGTTPNAAILSFTGMPKQDGHAFEKIIWIVAPETTGPVLVRAIAADGSRARFMIGDELELPGPGTHPEGYVYFPVPGCYTFQVDHSRGTHRITILVRP
jgi:hypothetical protein